MKQHSLNFIGKSAIIDQIAWLRLTEREWIIAAKRDLVCTDQIYEEVQL